jgi:hypothetical protein
MVELWPDYRGMAGKARGRNLIDGSLDVNLAFSKLQLPRCTLAPSAVQRSGIWTSSQPKRANVKNLHTVKDLLFPMNANHGD